MVDSLVETGLLTPEQAPQIKAKGAEAASEVASLLAAKSDTAPKKKPWHETVKVGGYMHGRWQYYPDAAADKKSNEFLLRYVRTKFTFQPTDRVKAIIQIDAGQNKISLTDPNVQYLLSAASTTRVRVGQSQLPFGLQTPQSSSVRLPFERNWLARRMFPGERDTGLVFFYTRPGDGTLFTAAKKHDYGVGDYGNLAIAVVNGQGINKGEMNSQKHVIIRVAKPLLLGSSERYAEVGASFMNGRYYSATADQDFDDRLFGLHAFVAPRPLGLQVEYYTGETEGADIHGWYGMGILRTGQRDTLFLRYDSYDGPRKGAGLGNVYDRHRTTMGYAHQVSDKTRLTVEYDLEPDNDLLGFQAMTKY